MAINKASGIIILPLNPIAFILKGIIKFKDKNTEVINWVKIHSSTFTMLQTTTKSLKKICH